MIRIPATPACSAAGTAPPFPVIIALRTLYRRSREQKDCNSYRLIVVSRQTRLPTHAGYTTIVIPPLSSVVFDTSNLPSIPAKKSSVKAAATVVGITNVFDSWIMLELVLQAENNLFIIVTKEESELSVHICAHQHSIRPRHSPLVLRTRAKLSGFFPPPPPVLTASLCDHPFANLML